MARDWHNGDSAQHGDYLNNLISWVGTRNRDMLLENAECP